MALDSVIPSNTRWIPRSMTVKYIAKATSTIVATSQVEASNIVNGDFIVHISVVNRAQEIVFTADITFYLSDKPIRG
jgi:hypothetical protein